MKHILYKKCKFVQYLFDNNLIDISVSEPEYAQVDGPDYRSNHFSQYNHNLLLEKTLDILN